MSFPLKTYRLIRYDAATMAVTADWIDAASDDEAIAKSNVTNLGSKCELWDGRRLVAQADAQRQQA